GVQTCALPISWNACVEYRGSHYCSACRLTEYRQYIWRFKRDRQYVWYRNDKETISFFLYNYRNFYGFVWSVWDCSLCPFCIIHRLSETNGYSKEVTFYSWR